MAVSPRISTKSPGGTGGINVRLTLYTPGITKDLRKQLSEQVLEGAKYLRDQIKQSLSNSSSSPGGPPAEITGALKESIIAERPEGKKMVAEVIQDADAVPYGPWLEFGAPNRKSGALPAYPFMAPAALSHKGGVKAIMSNVKPRTVKTNAIVIEKRR